MKAQPKCFAQCEFEFVRLDSFDFYKITYPLIKIIEILEKNGDRLVGGFVGNNTISDTTNIFSGNKRTVFEKIQAQIKFSLKGAGYGF